MAGSTSGDGGVRGERARYDARGRKVTVGAVEEVEVDH